MLDLIAADHSSNYQHGLFFMCLVQVVWNFQKAMRCFLVVLCFRAGFLHRQKLFDGDAHKWPNLVSRLRWCPGAGAFRPFEPAV